MHHLSETDLARLRAMAAHPSAQAAMMRREAAEGAAAHHHHRLLDDEDGSLVTEYGLLAVVSATIAGVVIQWASGGALVTLFNALLRHARSLVGA